MSFFWSGKNRPFRLEGAMLSDIGVRTHNEDSVAFVAPGGNSLGQDSLALVADGMGGHAAGEIACCIAVDVIRQKFFELQGSVPKILAAAFSAANAAILEHSRDNPECAGMGTTCTAIAIRENQAWIAHVGDSRAYLLRGPKMIQLSHDQTLVARLVREGTLTPEQAKTSDYSNVILQALGTTPELQPEITKQGITLAIGDVIVLCTDGLHGLVADSSIAQIASRLSPVEACEALVQSALDAGGHDNISIGVFHVVDGTRAEEKSSKRTTRRMKAPASIFEPGERGHQRRSVR
jgi:PPM family protein phosphatase